MVLPPTRDGGAAWEVAKASGTELVSGAGGVGVEHDRSQPPVINLGRWTARDTKRELVREESRSGR